MADKDEDGAWFAPKAFGFGAGLPIAWQGWALLVSYIALIALAAVTLLPEHKVTWGVTIAVLTLGLTALAAQHTKGGWRWRWGRRP